MGQIMAVAYQPKILENLAATTSEKGKARRTAEARRIEHIGILDDRHKLALGAGDRGALLELAAEYLLINCPNMASQITFEAENL